MTDYETAARVVQDGGVIAYPTESCFGLGCDPDNEAGIRRILEMKRRHRDKGLILIADRFDRFDPWLEPLAAAKQKEILASWPGPNTWLWPVRDGVSRWLTGQFETLAVRVTAHPVAARLSERCGIALVSTSANRATEPALRSATEVEKTFGREVDCVVTGRIGADSSPSTIRDARTGEVIRA